MLGADRVGAREGLLDRLIQQGLLPVFGVGLLVGELVVLLVLGKGLRGSRVGRLDVPVLVLDLAFDRHVCGAAARAVAEDPFGLIFRLLLGHGTLLRRYFFSSRS